MTMTVSTSGQIRVTLEIDWPHTFGEGATASDIYKTVAKECQAALERALNEAKVRFRIIGEIEPIMVIYPVKRP